MTAEAGGLGRSYLHSRCCWRYGVLLGALPTTTLLALRLEHCGCRTVRGLSALLADAKDNNRATDDEDDRHATANNKRQVSLDKVENILRQRMGNIGLVDVHMKYRGVIIVEIGCQNLAIAVHERKLVAPMRVKLALCPGLSID